MWRADGFNTNFLAPGQSGVPLWARREALAVDGGSPKRRTPERLKFGLFIAGELRDEMHCCESPRET